jgi:4-amino-4-deoxy-L-arabinose transferase-like glycosyltransferase
MHNRSKARLSVRCWGIVIFLLLVFFAQLAFSSRQLSLTSDEPPNLGVGYTYLTTGETWYISSLGQPPLLFAWEAVLVTLSNPHIPLETLTNWHEFPLPPYLHALFPLLGPVEQLEVLGRAPMMLLGVLLGGLVFRWAADLFGAKGGILALALMVFDPTIVAHTPLATGDLGIALIGFAMFFVAWRWARARRTPAEDVRWAVVVGLLGGATMAAKVSGFVWVGLLVGIRFFL